MVVTWRLEATTTLNQQAASHGHGSRDGLSDALIVTNEFSINPDIPADLFLGGPGTIHVLYGSAQGHPDQIELRAYLDGETGFSIEGFGLSQSLVVFDTGDSNGDGVGDLLVGNSLGSGVAHVIYGHKTLVQGSSQIDAIIDVLPVSDIRYVVAGEVRTDVEAAVVTFTATLPPGQSDSNPNNNSVTLNLGEIDTVLAGDVDNNGEVNFIDFLVLANNFGRDDDVTRSDGDLDEDGVVSFLDFLALASNFGRTI